MSNSTEVSTPYKSKDEFLEDGMSDLRLEAALNCSICREPLLFNATMVRRSLLRLPNPAATRLSHITVNEEHARCDYIESTSETRDITTATQTEGDFLPEAAVRISPCNDIFGRTCLKAWFTFSKSNRCPECNEELFPSRHMKLFLRSPTRKMCLRFAHYIEQICGDAETASEIRGSPMSEWTRSLIREFAMELWRQQGYSVEYQYVGGTETEEEGEETEAEKISDIGDEETDEVDIEESDIYDCDVAK